MQTTRLFLKDSGVLALFLLFVFVLSMSPSYAYAANTQLEPVSQCAQLIKECYASPENERTNCLFSSAKHPFCEGTKLGKLTYKRWVMSPVKPSGHEEAPAFLGPTLIDQQCLENFDNAWLSSLITPDVLAAQMNRLESQLSQCTKELSEELTRP